MADKILTIKKSTLVDIANEVRAKTGSTDLIKVADLDDAVKELSGGGGVIEVDILPEQMVVDPGSKSPVPASTCVQEGNSYPSATGEPIYIGDIYFNTNLSVEETIAEIKKVTQDLDAVYNKEMSVYVYYMHAYNDEDDAVVTISLYNNFNRDKDDNATGYSDRWDIYLEQYDSEDNTIFDDFIFTTEDGGWNPEFNGKISVNEPMFFETYLEWNEDIDWGGNPYVVNGIINMNDQLTNLVCTYEMVPNPEFKEEAIYKLPDETYWLYGENGFEQIMGKVDPMSLGTANNPEFGFYYGQVFSMDDPITINIPILVEGMQSMDMTELSFGNNVFNLYAPIHDTYGNYIYWNALWISCVIDQENNEMNIRIGNTDGYCELDYTYTVKLTENFTFTLRQLYKDVYTTIDSIYINKMSPEQVDAMLSNFPLKFGTVYPGYGNLKVSPIPDDWESGDLNNPENAIYKCLKIGK